MRPADGVARLLEDLCTQLGFCLPPAARATLAASPPADPETFTAAVFRAEGLEPSADRRLYAQVHGLILQRFAGSLRSDT